MEVIAIANLFHCYRGILCNLTFIERVKMRDAQRQYGVTLRNPYDCGFVSNISQALGWLEGDGEGTQFITRPGIKSFEEQIIEGKTRRTEHKFRAMVDFAGEREVNAPQPLLPLKAGSVVRVSRRRGQWLYGRLCDKSGWFPLSVVTGST
jgi:hypothetical protein